MKVTLWGTRGSLAAPGPDTLRYGGNTSCVEVRGDDGTLLVLDAGTGIRCLGETLGPEVSRIDLLLTHLPYGSYPGVGVFEPLNRPGPGSAYLGSPSTPLDLHSAWPAISHRPCSPSVCATFQEVSA